MKGHKASLLSCQDILFPILLFLLSLTQSNSHTPLGETILSEKRRDQLTPVNPSLLPHDSCFSAVSSRQWPCYCEQATSLPELPLDSL